MAALRGVVTFESIQIVTSANKTIVQLKAPSNQRVRITGFRIGCTGVVTTDAPLRVKGYQQTSAGTGGTSATPQKLEQSLSETIQTTAQTGPASGAWTAEPTAGVVQYENRVHPQGALNETIYYTCDIIVKGGDYFGLVVFGSQANTLDGCLYFEE